MKKMTKKKKINKKKQINPITGDWVQWTRGTHISINITVITSAYSLPLEFIYAKGVFDNILAKKNKTTFCFFLINISKTSHHLGRLGPMDPVTFIQFIQINGRLGPLDPVT